jgi:hypothetical protein
LVVKLKGTDHLKNLDVDGRILFGWIFGIFGGKLQTGYIWLRIGTNGGSYEYGYIKGRTFSDQLSDY